MIQVGEGGSCIPFQRAGLRGWLLYPIPTCMLERIAPVSWGSSSGTGALAQQAQLGSNAAAGVFNTSDREEKPLSKLSLVIQPSLLRCFPHNVTFSQEPLRNNHGAGAVCSLL